MVYYAVANGRNVGIFQTWIECEKQVKGFGGAKFKKFKTKAEAAKYIATAQQQPQTSKAGSISACSSSREYLAKKHGAASAHEMHMDENDEMMPPTQQLVSVKKEPQSSPHYENKLYIKKEVKEDNKDTSLWFEDSDGDQELLQALATLQETADGITTSKEKNRKCNGRGIDASTSQPLSRTIRIGRYTFTTDNQGYVDVYIGSHCENIGSWNCMAGYGVYFGDKHPLNCSQAATGRITTNVGDIEAAIHAITTAQKVRIKKLCIHTDSEFLLNAVTSWIFAWKRSGWRNKNGKVVQNRKEFEQLNTLLSNDNIDVKWENTKGCRSAEKFMREAKLLAEVGNEKYLDEHPSKDMDGSFDFDIDNFSYF